MHLIFWRDHLSFYIYYQIQHYNYNSLLRLRNCFLKVCFQIGFQVCYIVFAEFFCLRVLITFLKWYFILIEENRKTTLLLVNEIVKKIFLKITYKKRIVIVNYFLREHYKVEFIMVKAVWKTSFTKLNDLAQCTIQMSRTGSNSQCKNQTFNLSFLLH